MDSCAVCLEAMVAVASAQPSLEAVVLRCGHELHLACLVPCMLGKASENSEDKVLRHRCPVCRNDFSDRLRQALVGCYRRQARRSRAQSSNSDADDRGSPVMAMRRRPSGRGRGTRGRYTRTTITITQRRNASSAAATSRPRARASVAGAVSRIRNVRQRARARRNSTSTRRNSLN